MAGAAAGGRDGYVQTIAEDIRLAGELFRQIAQTPQLEALTQSLSITTFRFIPRDLKPGGDEIEGYLDQLNNELLTRLQNSGEAYLSNAIVRGRFALRACIVNFRTTQADIEALPPLIVRIGEKTDAELRPAPCGGKAGSHNGACPRHQWYFVPFCAP